MLNTLGASLKTAREARGWTIDEVEQSTRIRAKYLIALEAGDLDSLPSMLQARGFLRNYAQHLGLSPEQVLGQMDEALKPPKRGFLPSFRPGRGKNGRAANPDSGVQPHTPPRAAAPAASPVASARRLRRLFTPDLIIAFLAIAVVIGFLVWGGSRLVNNVLNPPPVTPTAEIIGPTETRTPTIIANITPSATPLPPGITFTNVQLTLVAERRTFVRIVVDGALAYEGLMLPEERREVIAQGVAEITTGDGSSIRAILNQRDLGLLGNPGEVVTRQFIPSGILTVTPTITFTPSLTLTASATLEVTLTPTATQTGRP